jgi:phosphate:Na+ symporter
MIGHMILINLLGGIALLVWGTNMVKTGVLGSFGPELRRALAAATKGRLRAAAAGIGAAAALQSSTATAMLLSGFVGRGLITLPAAVAVLLGADFGTSLVVQALAFDLSVLIPVLLLIGVATALSATADRTREIGRIVIGFALMILALDQIGAASDPLRESMVMGLVLNRLAADPILAVLFAAVLTWAFHSSVAFVLFVASLAATEIVSMPLALMLVLGANVGSGLIPIGLALQGPLAARRALYGNLGARLIGVMIALPLAGLAAPWLAELSGVPARQVAHAHSLFNLGLMLVFLPVTGAVAGLLMWLWPDPPAEGQEGSLHHLDPELLDRPALALNAATRELMRLADKVELMLRLAILTFEERDDRRIAEVRTLESEVDDQQEEIKLYLSRLMQGGLDERQGDRVVELILFTTNLEHVGDIIDRGLLAMAQKKQRLELRFSDEGWADIQAFHTRIAEQMRLALTVFVSRDLAMARDLVAEKDRLRALEQVATERHFERLREGTPESIETSALHLDVLRDLKRINAHLTTVAYPILEARGLLRGSRLKAGSEPSRKAGPAKR